jgi:hypothetical protein
MGMIFDEKGIPVVIQARRFELVDKEGCVLSRIEASKEGGGEISIYNNNGQRIATLSTTETGDGIFGITNKNGMWVAGIAVDNSGAGGMVIRNSKGKLATNLGVTSKDKHGLIIYNNEGKAIVSLRPNENGDGTIVTYSKDGKEIINTAKHKLKLKNKIATASTIYFITAIIAATLAHYISSWGYVRDYGPLIYVFGIISGSCFILSALALKRQEVVKYMEHSAVGVCDRELSP